MPGEERKQELLASIDAFEKELRDLRDRSEQAASLLEAAREQLRRLDSAPTPPQAVTIPADAGLDAAGKVALFRSLFRGREDVFPRLWVNGVLSASVREVLRRGEAVPWMKVVTSS